MLVVFIKNTFCVLWLSFSLYNICKWFSTAKYKIKYVCDGYSHVIFGSSLKFGFYIVAQFVEFSIGVVRHLSEIY